VFPTPWSVNLDSRSTGLSRCVEMHDIVVNAGKDASQSSTVTASSTYAWMGSRLILMHDVGEEHATQGKSDLPRKARGQSRGLTPVIRIENGTRNR